MNNSILFKNEYILAGRASTPESTLKQLAYSTEPEVRARVAENLAAPIDTMHVLLRDNNSDVRLALTQNENIPTSLLVLLAYYSSADVRYGMAENARLPQAILSTLTEDENPYVANRARRTLARLACYPMHIAA